MRGLTMYKYHSGNIGEPLHESSSCKMLVSSNLTLYTKTLIACNVIKSVNRISYRLDGLRRCTGEEKGESYNLIGATNPWMEGYLIGSVEGGS